MFKGISPPERARSRGKNAVMMYLFATLFSFGIIIIFVEGVWRNIVLQVLSEQLGAYFLHVSRHRTRGDGGRRNEGTANVGAASGAYKYVISKTLVSISRKQG